MTYITKTIFRMTLLIAGVLGTLVSMWRPLLQTFAHNVWLNGFIILVICFGIFTAFRLVFKIKGEQTWLDRLGREREGDRPSRPIKLNVLKAFSVLIEDEGVPSHLSTIQMKSILSSIEGRLDDMRAVTRYCIGALILLGLLATFWGLSQTVSSMLGVLSGNGINIQDASTMQGFLKALHSSVGGMGTAFSCSMFGLVGSLIIGFLDLQVGKAFSSFYDQFEERLSMLTRLLPFSSGSQEIGASGASGPAFSMGLLEQAIEGMAALHNQLKKNEDSRLTMTKSIQLFSEKLSEMSEYMMAHQGFSQRLAQNQVELQETLLNQSKDGTRGRNEEIVKTHIRSVDATLTKLLEEVIEGRARMTNDVRQEIRVVTRTLSAIANGQEVSS